MFQDMIKPINGSSEESIKSLYFEVNTAYSGYSDICNLSSEGINTGCYTVIMSIDRLESLDSSHRNYLALFRLINGAIDMTIKSGDYAYLRVSNGILQAHQELSSNPRKYYYYIYQTEIS